MRLLAFYFSVLAITMVYVQYSSTVSLSVSDAHGASAYATLLTLNGVLVIAGELPLSSWTRRLDWWILLAVGIVLMAVGIALSGAAAAYPVIAIAAVSPPDRIGRFQGYLGSVQAAAVAFGPAAGVAVYGWSPQALWVGCLVVGGVALVAIVAAGRHAGGRTRPATVAAAA